MLQTVSESQPERHLPSIPSFASAEPGQHRALPRLWTTCCQPQGEFHYSRFNTLNFYVLSLRNSTVLIFFFRILNKTIFFQLSGLSSDIFMICVDITLCGRADSHNFPCNVATFSIVCRWHPYSIYSSIYAGYESSVIFMGNSTQFNRNGCIVLFL